MTAGKEAQSVSPTSEQINQAFPQITQKRVKEELLRCRQGIAHDLEVLKTTHPSASGETLSQIITV